jgi:hypothetical protein
VEPLGEAQQLRDRREQSAVDPFKGHKVLGDPSFNHVFNLPKDFKARTFRRILRRLNVIEEAAFSCRPIFLGEDRTLSWDWYRTTGIAIGFFTGIRGFLSLTCLIPSPIRP